MRPAPRLGRRIMWAYLGLVLLFLYLPLVPPVLFSVGGAAAGSGGWTLTPYRAMWSTPLLPGAVLTTLEVGAIVALAAPVLGLLAGMAVRELHMPRIVLLLTLLPLFVPGVSMGLAIAFFFRELGIHSSLLTIAIVQTLWALPFATLVILTVMSTFDPIYLEAAYMSGAGRTRAFFDIEWPSIRPGVIGAASFSLILSFNETIRTALVQGPVNTVQTYIWATYRQVGLSPALYALMSVLILLTLFLVGLFLLAERRGEREAAPISPAA